jgi:hypothetical protein
MSHEQNMHHHLIYFANTQFITNKYHVWHSMLTNMQNYYNLDQMLRSRTPTSLLQQRG